MMRDFLTKIGNPQNHLPPVIHLAGTNGKGSTQAYLRHCLEEGGYRVHAYTSPHLVHATERILLSGAPISEEELTDYLAFCKTADQNEDLNFFQIITAAAFLAFSKHPADVLILEVGIGGRLDATNVIPKSVLTGITPISLDHKDVLGETLTQIAAEKAGIFRPGVPAVIGPQPFEAMAVLTQKAEKIKAPLFRYSKEWSFQKTPGGFDFSFENERISYPLPSLLGDHQLENAALAVALLKSQTLWPLGDETLRRGLQKTTWPGRLQHLRAGHLIPHLPAEWELWVDGGHNEAAAQALAAYAKQYWRDRPFYLMAGLLKRKDFSSFLSPFLDLSPVIIGVEGFTDEASYGLEEYQQWAGEKGLNFQSVSFVKDASFLQQIAFNHVSGRLLICGSLFLIGEILALNEGRCCVEKKPRHSASQRHPREGGDP